MGKERLAPPGFYVEYYGKEKWTLVPGSKNPSETFGVVYIPSDGVCKYIHWMDNPGAWHTLTWTCAPTKKKLEKAQKAAPDKDIERFRYFPTHADLCAFEYIHHKAGALVNPA